MTLPQNPKLHHGLAFMSGSVAPAGAYDFFVFFIPRLIAVGYGLSPLRGCHSV
jgi:hypothetical protein